MTPQETSDFTLDAMASLAAVPGSAHGVMGKGQGHPTLTSKSVVYGTPLKLFRELDAEFHFTTDVCSIPELALCEHYYTPEVDGLAQEWKGICWMNPPYGKEIRRWVQKAYEESQRGATVVGLLPARMDAFWFHDWIYRKAELRFPKGRLHFRGVVSRGPWKPHSAPFACMIAVWTPPSASAPNVPDQRPGESPKRLVRRVDRSPMNPQRFCCELECGHEQWVTSKRKPKFTFMKCSTCPAPPNVPDERPPGKPTT